MAGEETHDIGGDGLQSAKQWLDMTTRVSQTWTYKDRAFESLLEFDWPGGKRTKFTFDLGGQFRGEKLDRQSFLAEVKNYKKEHDLPEHFRAFLAKCYVALGTREKSCDNFLWISWSPFQAQKWDQHATAEAVRTALLHKSNVERVFGTLDAAEAEKQMDVERLTRVADRVWLLTMSRRQHDLLLTTAHYLEVVKMYAAEKVS